MKFTGLREKQVGLFGLFFAFVPLCYHLKVFLLMMFWDIGDLGWVY